MPKSCSLSSVYVPGISQRFVMCALAFIGTMVGWMMYYNGFNSLREIIGAQFYNSTIGPRNMKTDKYYHALIKQQTNFSEMHVNRFWPQEIRNGIFQSVWLGNIVSSVLSGIAADMFGPKHIWSLGILITSVTSFLLPLSATVNHYVMLIFLVFAGLGLGVMSSCSSVLIAHWAPVNERTIFVAFIDSGLIFGLIVDFLLHTQDVVWEYCLYASGVSSMVWFLVWYVLFYNHPEEHPHISPRELHYLETRTVGLSQSNCPRIKCKPLVPWKQILFSPPFMSLVILNFSACWVQCMLLYHMQTYIAETLYIVLRTVPGTDATGIALGVGLNSLLLNSWISDKLLSTGFITLTANRRFFLLFGNYISAILIFSIPLLGHDGTWVVVMFFITIHAQGMVGAPMSANVVDLSPRYAGLLRGILFAVRGLATIFCRQAVDVMVDNPNIQESWKWFFYLSAAIVTVFSAPYFCFGSGKIQTWNYHGQSETMHNTPIPPRTQSQSSEN